MIEITIVTTGPDQAEAAASRLANPAGLHARMAGAAETFLRDYGRATAPSQHRTANRLGATPTGHLENAYNRVESSASAKAGSVWVPGSSRLRAAFGSYTVRPTGGRKYLTIPVTPEAYGKRAGEIPDLVFMKVGPNETPILAKKDGERFRTYYLLTRQATIPEDRSLIPFDDLFDEAVDAAEAYLLEEATP